MNTMHTSAIPQTQQTNIVRWATVLILLTITVVGLAAALVSPMNAQTDKIPGQVNQHFQVSAWGFAGAGTSGRGCYIIDTQTGDLWAVNGESAPKKVSGKLE